MSTPGKPNIFTKGMIKDLDEGLQPKESYKDANNIRVTSTDGDNVSIQPFPSDRKAIEFTQSVNQVETTTTVSYLDGWLNIPQVTLGEIQPNWQTAFSGGYADVTPNVSFSGFGTNNADGNALNVIITLELAQSGQIVLVEDLSEVVNIAEYLGIALDLDTAISNIINDNETLPIVSTVTHSGEVGTESDTCVWTFVNTEDPDNNVVNMSIDFTTQADIIVNTDGIFEAATLEIEPLANLVDAGIITLEALMNMLGGLFDLAEAALTGYYAAINFGTFSGNILNIQPQSIGSIVADIAANIGIDIDNIPNNIKIIGHYGFSDYLVLFAKWPLLGAIQQFYGLAEANDMIIKVKQQKDGLLSTQEFELLNSTDAFSIYFVGNLEFDENKKLIVEGSEENYKIRRLYFTDTEFTLKTINVGLPPTVYSPFQNQPKYFNLFVPSVFSPIVVTGLREGGSLDSISFAYGYKYVTADGRKSTISPLSNPASVPSTSLATVGEFVQGAPAGNSTGKTIKGEIRNIDTRYSKVEIIAIPYIDNVPGTPEVFSVNSIPQGEVDEEVTIDWVHTGSEEVIEELSIDEININQIVWDTCKAMETKDNRLFCGNLKNTTQTIETDFMLASYDRNNKPHSHSGGNPNLFDDLMYSMGGIKFNGAGDGGDIINIANDVDGVYCEPYDDRLMYRYIKNPYSNNSALFNNGNLVGSPSNSYRGIFGAQSKYFNDPIPEGQVGAGEFEGVRVTFRILGAAGTPEESLLLDEESKLLQQDTVCYPPLYRVPSTGVGGYSRTYANPVYNSNYVGYRRGEIYRFGLLFYDKKGSPMFVKPLGDIRMPEHSTEYIVPLYNQDGEIQDPSTGNDSFVQPFPYFYQTSRDPKDCGFEQRDSYSQHDSSTRGNIVYPFFEVKLSANTTAQVGGYQIVRVPRTENNKTILTSGIIRKVARHHESNGSSTVTNRFTNDSWSLFTQLEQNVRKYDDCSFFTIDSPDAIIDSDFQYNAQPIDRIKLVESGFCQKQCLAMDLNDPGEESNVSPFVLSKFDHLNQFLADTSYNTTNENILHDDGYLQEFNAVNAFGTVWKENYVAGPEVDDEFPGRYFYRFRGIQQGNVSAFANAFGDDIAGDPDGSIYNDGYMQLGYHTKYYNKRVSCYPQYGFAKKTQDENDGSIWNNGGYVGNFVPSPDFNIGSNQFTKYLPFSNLQTTSGGTLQAKPSQAVGTNDDEKFYEARITFGKVIDTFESISSLDLNADRSYINASTFAAFNVNTLEYHKKNIQNKQVPPWAEDFSFAEDYTDKHVTAKNNKTIFVKTHGGYVGNLPIIRQNLFDNNFLEGVHEKLGTVLDQSPPAGIYSPEVTIASITRTQSKDTMYGGYSPGDFSRNIYQGTGAFVSVADVDVFNNTGMNGLHTFGGDTYIGYFTLKKNTMRDGKDRCVHEGYLIPLECNFNIALRHGTYMGSAAESIQSLTSDEYLYNQSFDSQNSILNFSAKPEDFKDINEWPSTIAYSEQKIPGEVQDMYSVFPPNQITDLDFTKGPITNLFLLKDTLHSLQHSGVARLSVNPRILIKSEDGAEIQAVTGSQNVLERFDYVSDIYGSQHIHNIAVTEKAAYFYDDNSSRFFQIAADGSKSKVLSMGDAYGLQSYFNTYKNKVINDLPLTNQTFDLPASTNYNFNKQDRYNNLDEGLGGIAIGYDPEYNEVLLTLGAEKEIPRTLVFNEKLQAFTSFVSKVPADYIYYKGRMYNTYNKEGEIDTLYLANGWVNEPAVFGENKYLNFGGIDYYIWQYINNEEVFKEPLEVEMVFNDVPITSKIFDKIQLTFNTDTAEGLQYLYFRKFAFKGAANIDEIEQLDDGSEDFANTNNLADSATRTWYSVKDGFHQIPMRAKDGPLGPQGKIRGNYATARLTMGWGDEHPSGADVLIKSEKFNIFSAVPFFRESKI